MATLTGVLFDIKNSNDYPVDVAYDRMIRENGCKNKNVMVDGLIDKLDSTSLGSSQYWNALLRFMNSLLILSNRV